MSALSISQLAGDDLTLAGWGWSSPLHPTIRTVADTATTTTATTKPHPFRVCLRSSMPATLPALPRIAPSGGSNLPGMSDEKADGADLERVLCAIAKDDGATPRDRVLAALTLRELAEVSAISNLQKLTRIGNLWRYRGEDGK